MMLNRLRFRFSLICFLSLIESESYCLFQFFIIFGLAQLNFWPVTGKVLLMRLKTSFMFSCILSIVFW